MALDFTSFLAIVRIKQWIQDTAFLSWSVMAVKGQDAYMC